MITKIRATIKQKKLVRLRKAWADEHGFPVSQCGGVCKRCNGPRCPYYKACAHDAAPEVPRRAA